MFVHISLTEFGLHFLYYVCFLFSVDTEEWNGPLVCDGYDWYTHWSCCVLHRFFCWIFFQLEIFICQTLYPKCLISFLSCFIFVCLNTFTSRTFGMNGGISFLWSVLLSDHPFVFLSTISSLKGLYRSCHTVGWLACVTKFVELITSTVFERLMKHGNMISI